MSRMNEIAAKYGEEYMLRQLAEECSELSQAALKLIRAKRKETPMREDEATEHLIEEVADVLVMVDAVCNTMLSDEEQDCAVIIQGQKEERMYARMLDGDTEEYVW